MYVCVLGQQGKTKVHQHLKTDPELLYEVHDIKRFKSVQRFGSYARLIRPEKESDGKWAGKSNKKIGNAHLKWAIKTAAMISLRESEQTKKLVDRLSRKHNKGKALGIYTHKLGRAIYLMLKNKRAFDMKHFFSLDRCFMQTTCCINFSGAHYCLTLTVESKSQIADPIAEALRLSSKNGRKENRNPILRGYYFFVTSAAI